MTHPTVKNLHCNEYTQGLHYYPFVINLDTCVQIFNTLNDLCNNVCVPNKTEDLNFRNDFTGINEWKALAKHISRECKCKFDDRTCDSYQKWNNDKYWCECKKHYISEKDYT